LEWRTKGGDVYNYSTSSSTKVAAIGTVLSVRYNSQTILSQCAYLVVVIHSNRNIVSFGVPVPSTTMVPEPEREFIEITSTVHEPPDSQNPSRDSDALEATELSRIRRQYSRASSSHLAVSVTVPQGGWERVKHTISKFWRHQISVVVAHDACRDHLGVF
jgi:hypothetical protein